MSDEVPQFRRGAKAAAEAAKFASFARTQFFKLEDGEKTILRFITDADGWISVLQHAMVGTKSEPEGFEGNWPEKMGAVCRRDQAFRAMYSDCYICDHLVDGKKIKRPGSRTWALACRREEVVEDGKILGYRDLTREVAKLDADGKPTDEVVEEKDIIVLNMGYKNFFSILEGFAGHYGTLLDRDYAVKRTGSGMQDTSYGIVPLDPVPAKDGNRFDLRNPEHLKRYGFGSPDEVDRHLMQVVGERATDEFYARFFDPTKTVSDKGNVTEETSPKAPSHDVSEERLRNLAGRIKGFAPKEGNGEGTEEKKQEAPASSGPRDFE